MAEIDEELDAPDDIDGDIDGDWNSGADVAPEPPAPIDFAAMIAKASVLERAPEPEPRRDIGAGRMRAHLRASGIQVTPEDIDRIVAGTQQETSAMVVARAWWANVANGGGDLRFLVLAGGVGIGKTVAAAWVLARAGGLAIDCDDLVRTLSPQRLEPRARELLTGARVVLLDDLGVNEPAGFAGSFYKLVKARGHHAHLATIITTNLNRNDFEARYEPRTVDRIVHRGRIVELTGASLRRRG